MAHSRELSCAERSLAFSSLRSALEVLPSASSTDPVPIRSYPTARIVRAYFPGSTWVRGKLYFPCASLTTDTVKLAPSRRALTTTPSMRPSCCELTTPLRATEPEACAMSSEGAQLVAPTAILPRAMARKSFDMGRLVAYAFAAVDERGLRGLRRLLKAQVPGAASERVRSAGLLERNQDFHCDFPDD